MKSYHSFVPISTSELCLSRISGEDNSTIVVVSDSSRRKESTADDLHPSRHAAAVYDGDWYLANVVEVSTEHRDVYLDFMKPKGPASSFS